MERISHMMFVNSSRMSQSEKFKPLQNHIVHNFHRYIYVASM